MADLQKMESEGPDFWSNLIKTYMLEMASVTVRGVPSIAEQQRMAEEEKERVEQQRKNLGPEGLQKKDKQLLEAMQQNEVSMLLTV